MNVSRFILNLKRGICLAAAVVLTLAAVTTAYAAQDVPVMEQRVTDDVVVLYIGRSQGDESAAVRIGTEQADDAVIDGGSGEFPIVTWLLVDNSLSIGQTDRVKLKDLLSELVAGKKQNERFNLCTVDEHLQILVQDSQDYTELKTEIDSIEHSQHNTYIIDALSEVLDMESARAEPEYARVVVVCDELSSNPNGLTKEELNSRLSQTNIPVYVFGCGNGNAQKLNEVYALSRQTGAQSWTLSSLNNTLDVVSAMSKQEIPLRATITIPESLKDGAVKGIQLTFSNGATAAAQVLMPFSAAVIQPEPEPTPQSPSPEPVVTPAIEPAPAPAPETERSSPALIFVALAVLAAAVILIAIIMIMRRKRERLRIKSVSDEIQSGSSKTVVLTDDEDVSDSGTVVLVNDAKKLMLRLTDRINPDRHFECPLKGRVIIGRDNTNQIVLDYDRTVSHKHCAIFVSGSTFKIRDLRSSNGTYVDGIRVVDEAEIANGSVIKLGRLELGVNIR